MSLNRKSILISLIGLDDLEKQGLGGITRIQKLLYLLEKETEVKPTDGDGFDFQPYKMGPYSSKLYDDLELLENLGLIESVPVANPTPVENQAAELSVDDLLSETDQPATDTAEEKTYRLTSAGQSKLEEIKARHEDAPSLDKIKRVKSKFSNFPLKDLLYYVYTRHPESTTESEIKNAVLGKRE